MRHRIELLAVTSVRALLRVLPRAVIRAMGASLGLLFYVLDRPRRRVAVANLTQAFPSRTEAECRLITRAVFDAIDAMLALAVVAKRRRFHDRRQADLAKADGEFIE